MHNEQNEKSTQKLKLFMSIVVKLKRCRMIIRISRTTFLFLSKKPPSQLLLEIREIETFINTNMRS